MYDDSDSDDADIGDSDDQDTDSEEMNSDSQENVASSSAPRELTLEQKRHAVEYWLLPGGKKRRLSSIQSKYRYVKARSDLYRWQKQVEAGKYFLL